MISSACVHPTRQVFRLLHPWLLFFSILISGCRLSPPPPPVLHAFYFWQTSLSLQPEQSQYLQHAGVKTLYFKAADVGLEPGSGEIIPLSLTECTDTFGLAGFQLTGTVFITNEVFRDIDKEQIRWLAEKVATVRQKWIDRFPNNTAKEWQIDCDWTAGTRESYFAFLQELKSLLPASCALSATIRLHQYKFPDQTGVPPVDRGMLMCYNTGDIDDPNRGNSIFNPDDAVKYLNGVKRDYPLPLDLVLPVFEWTLVYRNNELWKIIPGKTDSLYAGVLNRGTFVGGHYLRPGDLIRKESVSADLLKKAAELVGKIPLTPDARLAFFDLHDSTPRDYPAPLITAVCQTVDSIRAARR